MTHSIIRYCSVTTTALAILASLHLPALAGSFFNAQDLKEHCRARELQDPNMLGKVMLCRGYLMAVWDELIGSNRACAEGAMSASQVSDVVVKHLMERPERGHLAAVAEATDALMIAFPCQN